ncbi:SRPBCC family protein [Nocardioides humilatus]|nr:SRPBCC family protein [Nocardioides humilatus]
MHTAAALEDSIELDAPPSTVWAAVSDPRRMPEWSPQVTSVRLRHGAEVVELGTEFTNRNKYGELEWTTRAKVVRFEVEKEMAFRIEDNWVIWSFALAPLPDGRTLLTQRREVPDGISDLSYELSEGFMGGVDSYTEIQRAGMRETLEAIRGTVESAT